MRTQQQSEHQRPAEQEAALEELADTPVLRCAHCHGPFADANELHHCPEHRSALVHGGPECGVRCPLLGCGMPVQSYLGEDAREQIEQRVNARVHELRPTLIERLQRMYDQLPSPSAGVRRAGRVIGKALAYSGGGTLIVCVLYIGTAKLADSNDKYWYKMSLTPITGQVVHEQYSPEDQNTKELYCIHVRAANGLGYELTITDGPKMAKKQLADKIRVGDWVSFPEGNYISEQCVENARETYFRSEAKGKGFKPADRITIIEDQNKEKKDK